MVKVRKMEIKDLAEVWKLGTTELDLENKLYHKFWDQNEMFRYFTKDPEYCIVAEEEGEIIGFGIGNRKAFSQSTEDLAIIGWIVVHKKHRRKGVGTLLCNDLIEKLKESGAQKIIADVESTNEASIKMLEKLSFEKSFSVHWFSKELAI
jgi:ribosomal protein S18 acetylase RimI-like enzyme